MYANRSSWRYKDLSRYAAQRALLRSYKNLSSQQYATDTRQWERQRHDLNVLQNI